MTTKIINDLSRLISKYKSYLVEDEVAYFKNISFEIGNFYNLPDNLQTRNYKQAIMTQNSEAIL